MKRKYNLDFINDTDLFEHVCNTIKKYRFEITLKDFNKNLIDPIKLTFDSNVYGKTVEEIIESEVLRQIDKSNTNHIGYFHQNLFKYIGEDWYVPEKGFDICNDVKHFYIEMKNKHNTMNSSSAQKTYIQMQNKLLKDDKAVCFLVEVISKQSQNVDWVCSINGEQMKHKNIRRISIDKFYELVTGNKYAFKELCTVLPKVISDATKSLKIGQIKNSVFKELRNISPNIEKSIFLLAFKNYEGFNEL